MHLQQIKLTNFRNYEFETVEFSERLNLISGLNGMGKTNLLDAVYYLCMSKSHFQSTDKNVVRKGEGFFRLEGQFFIEKSEKVVAKVIPGKQKTFERNDAPYTRLSDHVGFLPVVFLAPDDTALALEGSEERRRFIDNTLCQLDPLYLDALVNYNRILDKRNAALKKFGEQGSFNPILLETYNSQLEPTALLIYEKRHWFIGQFQPVFNMFYKNISDEAEPVECEYHSQLAGSNFMELLEKSVEKDRFLERTTVGIHKDDLVFSMKSFPLKRFASQGQLKSFVLAMKLAQNELLRQQKNKKPLLLLDDLFDKLDDKRVAQLIELLVKGDFGQVFITDTHPERAEDMAKRFG
ncbi:MAG: DNA replication and repair protein RecF, partial [Saprospiraceae bacterium]|nr:DNA replication and repair protein RecF [Saprospiraceae bacterium]